MQITKDTPRGNFVIQGQNFSIYKPLKEGHVCTANEADLLNQTVTENTRNNLNKIVKDALDNGSFNADEMQAKIDEYVKSYEFGKRSGRRPSDPVEREALNIAREIVRQAYKDNGYKLADVETSEINRLANDLLEKNPDVRKEAKRRVEHRAKLAIDLPPTKPLEKQ